MSLPSGRRKLTRLRRLKSPELRETLIGRAILLERVDRLTIQVAAVAIFLCRERRRWPTRGRFIGQDGKPYLRPSAGDHGQNAHLLGLAKAPCGHDD